jgi:hypothetical protein
VCAHARAYVWIQKERFVCMICMICIIELISTFCDKVHVNTFLKTAHIRHSRYTDQERLDTDQQTNMTAILLTY